jgi:hypothetical protein
VKQKVKRKKRRDDMRSLQKISAALAFAAALAGGPAAQAQDAAAAAPEMPGPYDCTLTKAALCKAGAECSPVDKVGELALPARLLVDFEAQRLAGVGPDGLPHVSEITDLARSGDILVALGVDGGTGWMIHSTANDDEVTFVAASDDFIVNAFGTCKPAE